MRAPLLLLLGVLILTAGCSGPDPLEAEPAATSQVTVADNVFEPVAIQVDAGTEVVWTWEGSNQHNVVSDTFESELVTEGTFRHTFDEPGEITYICTIHPAMRGAVIVEG